jgi:hypothetical protein
MAACTGSTNNTMNPLGIAVNNNEDIENPLYRDKSLKCIKNINEDFDL